MNINIQASTPVEASILATKFCLMYSQFEIAGICLAAKPTSIPKYAIPCLIKNKKLSIHSNFLNNVSMSETFLFLIRVNKGEIHNANTRYKNATLPYALITRSDSPA